MSAIILRCVRCFRDCSGVRCPVCGGDVAQVDLTGSIGATGVEERQRAIVNARRQRIAYVQQLDIFGTVEIVDAQPEPAGQMGLFE